MVVVGFLAGGSLVRAQPNAASTGVPNAGSTGTDKSSTQTQTFTKLQNPLEADDIQEVIFLAVDIAMYVGGAFAILAIIFVGFKFVFAQGNATELTEAKKWLLYIIIGLAILISAKVIVEVVKNTLVKSGVVDQSVFTLPN